MSVKDEIPAIFLDKISPHGLETIQKCKDFVNDWCIPADRIASEQVSSDPAKRWQSTPPVLEKLKVKAKELGLWNMFLSKHYAEGAGYTNLEYGIMAGYLGRSMVAPDVTNTNAPDTGNMEILAKYGTPWQKEKYLKPLLNGDIRSAFLMTEKGTSSSNALNISCSAIKNEKGNFVINGTKWFASGAGDPRTAVWMVMCKTDNSESIFSNHTVLLLDAKRALASGNARNVRPLQIFGYDSAPHGHCEIQFDNYEVQPDEMEHVVLHKLGTGFQLIQSRLGPGRIHHCMRLIGVGEYALTIVQHRANHRKIFGKPMKLWESFFTTYAQSKIDIQKCRLLVLNAAHQIDISNAKVAQREIAMAKIETPRTILKILDWCIQMFGAEGVSQDTELALMYAHARVLRIADGPDEAHLNQIGRRELDKSGEADEFFERFKENQAKIAKL